MLRRSVEREKLRTALDWFRSPARFADRWLKPRLERLVRGVGLHLVAVACIAIAAAMPLMEVVPFSANGAGVALTAFGLSLVTRDGVVALLALAATFGTLGLVGYHLLL